MRSNDAHQHEIANTLSKLAQLELQPSAKASTGRPRGKRSGMQHERTKRALLTVIAGPTDLVAGLGVWVVGLGGLEPPTSSLSGIIGHDRYVLRPRSAGLSVCPRVTVTNPGRPPDRARLGHGGA
jgi:hypothetical protein